MTRLFPRPIRLAAVVALRRNARFELVDFLGDQEPRVVLEAARAINDVPIRNDLPALAALADAAQLDPLLKRFAGIRAAVPAPGGGASRGLIRDVRADQPGPAGDENRCAFE